MSNLVIVAIPEEQDRTWKISSEQVPHLTLLFLGDEANADTQQIVQFVEHAVTMSEHGQFYLDVERRGTLGPDDADVLFFSKRSWNLKWIKQFRGQLLQNQAVRTAYDSTQQYEEWIPHLTLGYPLPGAPAKPLGPDDHPIYSVCFDRIAVWTTDFDGPGFQLEWPERELEGPLAVAYSDTQKAALAHYGVKGMKWGQRKVGEKTSMFDPSGHDKGTDIVKAVLWPAVPPLGLFAIPAQVRLTRAAGRGIKAKSIDVNEKRFQAHAHSAKNFVKIHNGAGEQFNHEIQNINKKYPQDLTKDSKAQKKYDGEVVKLMQDSYRNSANSIGNKPNTMHLDVSFHGDGQDFKIHAREGAPTPLPHRVTHADTNTTEEVTLEITGKIQRDPTGHIIGFTIDGANDTVAQATARGAEFIEHHGVKGMKWGVRNRKGTPTAVTPTTTSKVPHGSRRKTKIKTEGGENHPAHEDAIKVAVAKAKLKKSGPAALSNQELRDVANRVQLENQVKVLTSHKGRQFVTRQFQNEGQNLAREGVRRGAKKGVKKVGFAAALA